MDPASIGMLMQAGEKVSSQIPNIAQAGYGIYQAFKGNQLANSMTRPEYQIPEEVLANLSDAQIQALEGLPAEQKQAFVENIQRGSQSAMRGLGDRSAGISGISSIQQNEADSYRELLGMDARQRQANQANLMNQRSNVADYRDKAWDYNVRQPYDETMAAAEAMKGAGLQNIFGGLKQGVQQSLDYKMYQDMLGQRPPVPQQAIAQNQGAIINQSSNAGIPIPIDQQTALESYNYGRVGTPQIPG